jgi:hypothetical protein
MFAQILEHELELLPSLPRYQNPQCQRICMVSDDENTRFEVIVLVTVSNIVVR